MKKKKLITLLILFVLIVFVATLYIYIQTNTKTDKKNTSKKSVDTIKTTKHIQYNEYSKLVNEYGDDVYNAVIKYYEMYGKVPTFDDIKEDLKESPVKCSKNVIYKSGTVNLDGCTVEGYQASGNHVYMNLNNLGLNNVESDGSYTINVDDIIPIKLGTYKYEASRIYELTKVNEPKRVTFLLSDDKIAEGELYYTLSDGILNIYFRDLNNPDITYSDVINAYYDHTDCMDENMFIIYTNDKIILVDINDENDGIKLEEVSKYSLNNSHEYKGAYSVYIQNTECGIVKSYVVKNSKNEYIDISNETKIDVGGPNLNWIGFSTTKFPLPVYITDAKLIAYDSSGGYFLFFIDKDNNVYGVKDNMLTLLTNKNANLVTGNQEYFKVTLEDGSLLQIEYMNENVTKIPGGVITPDEVK